MPFAGLAIVVLAVYLMARRVEVRLVLLGAGLLMALLAGKPLALLDEFARGMVAPMVAPILAAMGFAAVLGATGCDRHLVRLLLGPIRRFPWLALPGGILAAYFVNAAIPSQTSTAAALGPILLPLLVAAGLAPETAGAALVLGASFGGDLLNPGAQDVQAIAGTTGLAAAPISARVLPASLAGALTATLAFTMLNRGRPETGPAGLRSAEELPAGHQAEVRERPAAALVPQEKAPPGPAEGLPEGSPDALSVWEPDTAPRLDLARALVPLVPIALLLLAYGLEGNPASPFGWLLAVPAGEAWMPLAGALPVVRAMLLGTLLALALGWREAQEVVRSLFEGMGAGYAGIISLTIAAQCFGRGVALSGISGLVLRAFGGSPILGGLLAAGFPWFLAFLSGSGSGPVLTYAQTFLAQAAGEPHAVSLAAVACLAGAFGRTMSPVAAVVVYTAGLSGVSPVILVRRLLPALLAGAAVSLALAALR